MPSHQAPPPPPTRQTLARDVAVVLWFGWGRGSTGRSGSAPRWACVSLTGSRREANFWIKDSILQGFARSQGLRAGGRPPLRVAPFPGLPIAKDALRTQAPAIRRVQMRL
jgi:hypothetical protein